MLKRKGIRQIQNTSGTGATGNKSGVKGLPIGRIPYDDNNADTQFDASTPIPNYSNI